jgi:hypothetical protein
MRKEMGLKGYKSIGLAKIFKKICAKLNPVRGLKLLSEACFYYLNYLCRRS